MIRPQWRSSVKYCFHFYCLHRMLGNFPHLVNSLQHIDQRTQNNTGKLKSLEYKDFMRGWFPAPWLCRDCSHSLLPVALICTALLGLDVFGDCIINTRQKMHLFHGKYRLSFLQWLPKLIFSPCLSPQILHISLEAGASTRTETILIWSLLGKNSFNFTITLQLHSED